MTLSDNEILKQAKIIRRERRRQRKIETTKKILQSTKQPTPLSSINQRYPIILIDPPWRYEGVIFNDRSPENHYPTMTVEELITLPINQLITPNATVFVWTTNTHLAKCIKIIEAWELEYVTNLTWVKDKIGMGYYVRNQHELLLIARKGTIRVTPSPENCSSSVLLSPRTKHSKKPPEIYQIIEQMYPDLPKLELFARQTRTGWDTWGNEI